MLFRSCRIIHEALVPAFVIVLAEDARQKETIARETGGFPYPVRVVQIGAVPEELSIP